MLKIFKNLVGHWKICILITAILVVQAFCDLGLPGYTSDIVDTGIQMGGITSTIPKTVRESTLSALEWFMTEEEAEYTESCYSQADGDGIRTLLTENSAPAADATELSLETILTKPDILLYMTAMQLTKEESVTPEDLDAAAEKIRSVPAAMKSMILGQVENYVTDDTLELMSSQAMLCVNLEYQAQGIAEQVQRQYLYLTGAKMLGMTLLLVLCSILVGFLSARVGAAIGRDLRVSVFRKVVSFSQTETDRFSTASLITRTTNDIQQVQMVCVIMLRMIAYAPILGIGGILRVASMGSSLTWIIALTVVCLLCVIGMLIVIAMPKFKIMQTLVDRLNLVSREILTGIMPIRAFSREHYEEKRFDKANIDLMKTQLFTNRVMAGMMPFMTVIMNGASLLIVWFGGLAMDAGTMQIGEMIAFITYTMQIVMSFLMLTMVAIMLPRAGVAADRIDEVIQTEPVIHDPEQKDLTIPSGGWKGKVCFENVSFTYPGGETDAIEHISFTAEPGKTTAVIGSTGCGKSTIVNLIPRFFDVTQGRITVDGVDIRDMKQETLRDLIGYVPQKAVLFSGTIESNLKFDGEHISDDRMKKAAAIAQAEAFILEKTEQYQTPIAQGGGNVSGGQKQRLSIARAIAKNPKIYLFDDSFSALDFKTDAMLRRALKAETKEASVIIVAQRISTVLHADQILVLDEGRIVGRGKHSELMSTCPEYQEIAKSQLSQKDLHDSGLQAADQGPDPVTGQLDKKEEGDR